MNLTVWDRQYRLYPYGTNRRINRINQLINCRTLQRIAKKSRAAWFILVFIFAMEKDSDSTVTSLDENTENFCTNPTRDVLAEGITNLFKPSIEKLDERVSSTIKLQAELRGQLDALALQLRGIEKAQNNIPEFADKVKELINVKHKVTIITNVLSTSQERLVGLHKLIEKEQLRRQALLDSALATNIS